MDGLTNFVIEWLRIFLGVSFRNVVCWSLMYLKVPSTESRAMFFEVVFMSCW